MSGPLSESLSLVDDPEVASAPHHSPAVAEEGLDAQLSAPSAQSDSSTPAPTPAPASDASAAPAPASASGSNDSSSSASGAARSVTDPSQEKVGWMSKKRYDSDEFRRYWFTLIDNTLSYYDSDSSSTPRGTIALEGCSCEVVPESKYGLAACFDLNSPLAGRVYSLSCTDASELTDWVLLIRGAMLRIRRIKAKEAARRKREAIEGAAVESHAAQLAHREAQMSLANAALASSQSGAADSAAAHQQQQSNPYAVQPPGAYAPPAAPPSSSMISHYESSASGNGAPTSSPPSASDQYAVYSQWISESKRARAASTSQSRGGGGAGQRAPGELHHTLLLESDQRKEPSIWEEMCGPCCPAWCFR